MRATRPLFQNLAAALLASALAAISLVGQGLHLGCDHDSAGHDGGPVRAVDTRHCDGCAHHHPEQEHEQQAPTRPHHDSDDCPVCQFFAQAQVLDAGEPDSGSVPHSTRLVTAAVPPAPAASVREIRSRGPPAALS